MKVIIAGSRNLTWPFNIKIATHRSGFDISEVVSGTARGIDQLGEEWAKANLIPIKKFPADWDKYGKSAGYKRNVMMSDYADALISVWDGESRGTKHMIDIMNKKGKPVFIYKPGE